MNNTNRRKSKTCVTIVKNSIKILSWNIQASSSADGNKFDDKEFIATINKHDFVCLQETRQEVHLAGFRSICNTRKDKKSGGVAILIRNELIEGVEVIKNIKNSEYLICRLDKNFFRLSQDIFIINVYVKPLNSSSSTQLENGRDTLKQIEDLVNDLKKDGDVALCGDFNARTGISPGLVSQDSTDHIPLPEDYDPDTSSPRNSLDSITNTYGKIFLDLIKNNQLTILNGRTLGDLTGNFTSIQKNGCSVIDYIAVSSNLKCDIKYFKVLPFTEYSDHRPISTELNIKQISVSQLTTLHETYEKAPSRFIFNEENKDMFCNIQGREASLNTVTNLNLKIKDILDMNGEEADIEKAVKEVNNNITEHMRNLAEECFKKTKPLKNSLTSKKPWFNWGTRLAKREFRKATTSTDMFPQSEFLRHNFYKVKSKYKKYVNKTRNKFFEDMNTDIENGKVLNWQAFKKLKQQKTNEKTFDSYDMKRFENFFSNLYSDNHKTVTADQKKAFLDEALDYNSTLQAPESLNNPIDDKEICLVIKSLKQGKASAKDMINNEILKSLNSNYRSLLQNLFNVCLTKGIYPWNCSIITPLHKKGDKADPDNYRAVAVSSVIGKLFSTILLERLVKFRLSNHPDPPNQLGFTKKAQTYDHILTMKTIISKYMKLKKPVYAIFVDFKKAFDSVCRQALFLKLAKSNMTGKFFNVLRNMYSNSYAHIKLSGHLSKKINIRKGTEQGHPLSPDLFKVFLSDLSPLLDYPNCPYLSNVKISHLLWADDLILLSLDKKTAQKQLNALAKFCQSWGIEINELKTQVVIFQKNPPSTPDVKFELNGSPIKIVDSYSYLGIILHQSGSVQFAQKNLKTKAMRAFFGLKRAVIRSKLSFKALTILFDSLIKPIVLYGAPIWAPNSSTWSTIAKASDPLLHNQKNFLKTLGGSIQEKVHLSFLKWALGVHRKASNIGVWGESGRSPLFYESIRLSINYFKRLENLDSTCLVSAALREQKKLKLPWFTRMKSVLQLDETYSKDHVAAFHALNPKSKLIKRKPTCTASSFSPSKNSILVPIKSEKYRPWKIMESLTGTFKTNWEHQKSSSPKLSFYHKIKSSFGLEPYLESNNFKLRYSTTQFRISAHDLQVERGRYINLPRDKRTCLRCKTTLNQDIIEDEPYILFLKKLNRNLNKNPSPTKDPSTI